MQEKCIHTHKGADVTGAICQNMSLFHRLRGKYIKYNAVWKARGGARKMLTQTAGRWHFGDFKT